MIHWKHLVAEFTKAILRPGTYWIDRKDGSRTREYISPQRIDKMVTTFAKMRDNELNVPLPWRHDQNAMPRLDLDDQDVDAYKNAGFLKEVWKGDDGVLYGKLDVPNRTDSQKVGKTVVECSPRIDPLWKDGLDNQYEDAITHLALVTHPVIPGQDNFEPVEEPGLALSLGSYIAATDITALPNQFATDTHTGSSVGVDSIGGQSRVGNEGFDTSVHGSSGDVKTAIQALSLMGIVLPEDTELDDLPGRIVVAATNYVSGKEQSDDISVGQSTNKRPKGSKEQASPIIMSKDFEAIIANQQEIGQRLADGQELTVEFLEGLKTEPKPEPKQFSREQEAMLTAAADHLRSHEIARLEACVHKGKIPPKVAKEQGVPLIERLEFAISPETKQRVRQPWDEVIEAWEAIPDGAFMTGKSPTTVKQSKVDLFGETAFSLQGMAEEMGPTDADFEPPADEEGSEELALSLLKDSGIPYYE